MKILVVDDHGLFREGLRKLAADQPDMELVAEASSVEEALPLIERHAPDVVLLDVSMPGMDGLSAIKDVKRRAPGCGILVLTMFAREEYAARALADGALGYALKNQTVEEIVTAVRAVANGDKYLSPSFASEPFDTEDGVKKMGASPLERLTKRERQVFTLAVRGYSNDGIAKELGIGVKTVETHRARINMKLDAHGTGDLIRAAVRYGLVSDLASDVQAPDAKRAIVARVRHRYPTLTRSAPSSDSSETVY